MPGLIEDELIEAPAEPPLPLDILKQNVELDVDFLTRRVTGKTKITVQPKDTKSRRIRMNCRQSRILAANIRTAPDDDAPFVPEHATKATYTYTDGPSRLSLHPSMDVHQHHLLRAKVKGQQNAAMEQELELQIPDKVRIVKQDTPTFGIDERVRASGVLERTLSDGDGITDTPTRKPDDEGPSYKPLEIYLEFVLENIREGLQFVGLDNADKRYPHVYTRNSPSAGGARCLFPCFDDDSSRCDWELAVRVPRTLGDISPTTKPTESASKPDNGTATNGTGCPNTPAERASKDPTSDLTAEEKLLDILVIGSGDMTDEIIDERSDPGHRTFKFSCLSVLPQHVGFCAGVFEHVDLSDFRESETDERLGRNAIRVHGFCLPGRAEEVKNTCMPLSQAMDYYSLTYGSYPFNSYKICFVDDLSADVVDTNSLSICSTRLLFPEDIIDPLESVTRKIMTALATQWIGINIIPQYANDLWLTLGGALFMADDWLKQLMGRNDYRYKVKLAMDKVVEMDHQRPCLAQLGNTLMLDPSEREFLELKASTVLYILNSRIMRVTGRNGVARCFYRILSNNDNGNLDNGALTTNDFMRACEKVGHIKLAYFFEQWVHGIGCPEFVVQQRFNKKKLVVEMTISQTQARNIGGLGPADDVSLQPSNFAREVKEYQHEVFASEVQPVFKGPMTIRIHEADGTPYEHIVEIKEALTRVDIPYNTKYKRLKRSKRQKERAAAAAGLDASGEAQDDVLLYCLGDVLQSDSDVKDWRLADWSHDDEEKMNQESYEWIRMDADFEWICKLKLQMPAYMFVSQLQQDKDVVAQIESLQFTMAQIPVPLVSTILIRTVMDERYFHGVRTMAVQGLAKCATPELEWIGLFHLEKAFEQYFCIPGSPMTRSNDFSDRARYCVQCAIPRAIAEIRDYSRRAPLKAKQFLLEKLKFNDNSKNDFSDCYYVAILLSCLAKTLSPPVDDYSYFGKPDSDQETDVQKAAIEEIERYRRIDEWLPSYHNIYTTTALDCHLTLMRNEVIQRKTVDFLNYVRHGNADLVRLKGFECLASLGVLKAPAVLKFLLYTIEVDRSPFIRERLEELLGYVLGMIALGEESKPVEAALHQNGFTVEYDGVERPLADKQNVDSVPAALDSLKRRVGDDLLLKTAFENALRSKVTSVREVEELLEFCAILYDPIDRMPVTLQYPRHWSATHAGDGKMIFKRTNRYRTKSRTPLQKKAPAPAPAHVRKPTLQLKMSSVSLPQQQQPAPQSQAPQVISQPQVIPRPQIIPRPMGQVISQPSAQQIPQPPITAPHPEVNRNTMTPALMSAVTQQASPSSLAEPPLKEERPSGLLKLKLGTKPKGPSPTPRVSESPAPAKSTQASPAPTSARVSPAAPRSTSPSKHTKRVVLKLPPSKLRQIENRSDTTANGELPPRPTPPATQSTQSSITLSNGSAEVGARQTLTPAPAPAPSSLTSAPTFTIKTEPTIAMSRPLNVDSDDDDEDEQPLASRMAMRKSPTPAIKQEPATATATPPAAIVQHSSAPIVGGLAPSATSPVGHNTTVPARAPTKLKLKFTSKPAS